MFACLCAKKKSRSSSVHVDSLVPPDPHPGVSTQSHISNNPPDSLSSREEKSMKLEELRSQFVEAQKRQAKPVGKSAPEQVVGYVEIPLYKAEGRALKDAGESYQLVMYDK